MTGSQLHRFHCVVCDINKSVFHFKSSRHLEPNVTIQNSIHEEIKNRLNPGNACYDVFHDLLSSPMLFRNVKTITYKTTVLPVALCFLKVFVSRKVMNRD
jgi:hypothetical protein